MTEVTDTKFREVTRADVSAMSQLTHSTGGAADPRMAAYFDRQHHPQQALPARIGFVALANEAVVGYIAGHRTTRHGCEGEVQYLFVAPQYRRRGIATGLLSLLGKWFVAQSARKVCVALAGDSPAEAKPFYESVGAAPLKKHWYAWNDISTSL